VTTRAPSPPPGPIVQNADPRAAGAGGGRRAFLTAEWRHLLMLNYEVAPSVLEPLVPAGATLDLWEGRALASVVGFRFLRTRVLGAPVPFHRDFDEVNLRFYVRHEAEDGAVRRGVTFVRELVPRAAIALVARLAYNEPYQAVPMRSTTPAGRTDPPGRLSYGWRTGAGWQHVAATAVGAPAVPAPTDEAAFIAEHYWGYTRQRDGGTVEYQVAHPPWRVWGVEAPELAADVAGLYGAAFVPALAARPTSAFVAEGSPVTVYRPRRLRGR
jgi:uncharacterized protein YqjF (DUF2071 family)